MTETQTGVRSTRWLWIAAIWFAGGVFDASQNVPIMHKEGRHHSWLPLFLTELALWLPWALATPFISRLARQYTTTRGVTVRTAGVHLAFFAILSVVAEAWSAALQVMFNPWGSRRRIARGNSTQRSHCRRFALPRRIAHESIHSRFKRPKRLLRLHTASSARGTATMRSSDSSLVCGNLSSLP
jgi:hypothetical protein